MALPLEYKPVSAWVQLVVLFAAIALITAAVLQVIRELVTQRSLLIQQRLSGGAQEMSAEELLVAPTIPRGSGPIGQFDTWFDRFILETGVQWNSVAAFLAMVAAGVAIGGSLFLWKENLILSGVGMFLGMLVVWAIFAYIRYRRLQLIDSQLPEVLELIARAVRAGETLDQAVELVAATAMEPSASELRFCTRQMQLGLSVEATFRALTQRIPLPELRLFAAALVVQRRAGGSLAITLERFAKAIRERHGYRRQLRVATAAARWSSLVIVMASVGLLIYLFTWQPDYINNFLSTRMGQAVFIIAILLQVTGVLWVLSLIRPEV
jgi:tight adherence protein B